MAMKCTPINIETEDAFQEAINTPDRLIIVDVYSEWCKPCICMVGTYEACVMTIDEFNDRVNIYYGNADKIESLQQYQGTSQPRFLFYKGGEQLATVVGANAPEMIDLINAHIPAKQEE